MTASPTLSQADLEHVVGLRHDLHMHPEIAYEERRTAQVIERELTGLGLRTIAGLAGGTGVVAHLPATEPGAERLPAIGLRADIDALPIHEQTRLPYASTIPGRMHACGHDGHTAILLGVARTLARARRPRSVTLVFQPAEEGGGGGERLCQEGLITGKITGTPIERMYGLHGWPDLPQGVIGTRPGPLLASTDELRVTIRGTQAHAAYPHYGRDPVVTLAQCITALQTIASRTVSPTDSVVLSVCLLSAGTAVNVIPQTASTRELAKRRIGEVLAGTAMANDCVAEVTWEDGYPVTYNDPALTERWFATAEQVVGPQRVVRIEHPTMGGEDFSYYAREVPSVFFCLGLRRPGQERHPTLHQPDFDFNDDAIPLGVEMFCRLATQ
jgi:amidohydrolase